MNERGMTLVDLTIATMIVAVVIGLSYSGFHVADATIDTAGTRDRMERAADDTLKRLVAEVRTGRLLALSASPAEPSVTLAQPAANLTLADLDASGAVLWAADPATIRFRPVEVIRESVEHVDLNRDGDRSDVFAVGLLEIATAARTETITNRARVFLALPGYAGDLDGDGVGDPLFSRDGDQLTIELHLVSRTRGGEYLTTRSRVPVKLRNPQE